MVDNFIPASRRGREMRASIPRAVSARFDPKTGHIVVRLSSKLMLSFRPADVQGLRHAQPAQLQPIEISPSGFGIHFPKLDADLYLPGLLQGALGSRKWMAAQLGEIGGQSTSSAKRRAARANGKLGGRPRKRIVS